MNRYTGKMFCRGFWADLPIPLSLLPFFIGEKLKTRQVIISEATPQKAWHFKGKRLPVAVLLSGHAYPLSSPPTPAPFPRAGPAERGGGRPACLRRGARWQPRPAALAGPTAPAPGGGGEPRRERFDRKSFVAVWFQRTIKLLGKQKCTKSVHLPGKNMCQPEASYGKGRLRGRGETPTPVRAIPLKRLPLFLESSVEEEQWNVWQVLWAQVAL